MEAQTRAMHAWCARHRAVLVTVHQDVAPAVSPLHERPGFLALVNDVRKSGAGLVLVASWVRIGGVPASVAVAQHLVAEVGARIEAVDASDAPAERTMKAMREAILEYQRAKDRVRRRASVADRMARGKLVGQPPYGWQRDPDGRTLVQIPEEQAVVQRVVSLYDQGHGAVSIAGILDEEGVHARGAHWHPTTVKRILAANLPAQ